MRDNELSLDMVDVSKNYQVRRASVRGLRGMTLQVPAGSIFGLLGPNGAGKTTSLEIAMGMRFADSGRVRTLGLDPVTSRDQLRAVACIQPQEVQLFEFLTVREILRTWASFYPRPLDVDEVIAELSMDSFCERRVTKLSGGQRQRLNVALALVGDPRLLILDEPSTGLDPVARQDLWAFLERTRDRGVSIILSTHLMDEAERVCDRVAIIDVGRCVIEGHPADLIRDLGGDRRLSFRYPGGLEVLRKHDLPRVGRVERGVEPDELVLHATDTDAALFALTRIPGVHDISVRTRQLSDVYFRHTGKNWSEAPPVPELEGVRA